MRILPLLISPAMDAQHWENICHSGKAGDKELVAYQIPDFCTKHLFVLEVLSFQAVNMTLHLEWGICNSWRSWWQKTPTKSGAHEKSVLTVGNNKFWLQE